MSESNKKNPRIELKGAILALVDVLLVQKASKWTSSEEEEIVGAECAQCWEKINSLLSQIEWDSQAAGEAKAVMMTVFYMRTFKYVEVDEFDLKELSEVVGPDNPSWYTAD